jgi:hypothetical protein
MHVPLTINDFLDRAAAVYPDRIAIIDEPDQPAPPLPDLTWREVADLRRQMGVAMDKMGLAMGARVAVASPNAARFLLLYYGVCGNGRVVVPINWRLKRDEVEWIVQHSGAEVLLLDPDVAGSFGDIQGPRVIVMGEDFDRAWFDHSGQPQRCDPAETDVVTRVPRAWSRRTARAGPIQRSGAGRWASPTATCISASCRCFTATAGGCRIR